MFSLRKTAALAAVIGIGLGALAQTALAGHECCSEAKDAGLVCSACFVKATADVSKPAIDFTLKDAEGKDHRLSSVSDRIVVLTWTNPDCPFIVHLNKEKAIDELAAKYDGEKVLFANIDSTHNGSVERTAKTAKNFDQKVVTLLDFDGKIGRMYGAKTTPHAFVIDTEGKLRYAGAFDNAPLGKVGDGGDAINYVEAAVDAILAGKSVPQPTTKSYGCPVKYAKPAAPASAPASRPTASLDESEIDKSQCGPNCPAAACGAHS